MSENIGDLVDALHAMREKIAVQQAKVDELKSERTTLEERLLNAMSESGITAARGTKATVSVTPDIRPQLVDPDKFFAFVLRNKAVQLLERRIAKNAYLEMKTARRGKAIPGVTEISIDRLNVRKVNSDAS